MKKKFLYVVKILLISLIIEIFIINFSNIVSLFETKYEKNITINNNSITYENWETKDNKIISNLDPMIIIEDINKYIDNIELTFNSNVEFGNITLYYTTDKNESFNGEKIINYTNIDFSKPIKLNIKKDIVDLRIDLDEKEGLVISDLSVELNKWKLDLNIYRVFAIISICLMGKFLFIIQQNPDYDV